MRARYYDPTTGRWDSQDPLTYSSRLSANSGNLSLYEYVGNSPTSAIDASGKDFIAVADRSLDIGFENPTNHYSLEYWCGGPNPRAYVERKTKTFQKNFPRATRIAGVQLLNDNSFYVKSWWLFLGNKSTRTRRVGISWIDFNSTADSLMAIIVGTPALVQNRWNTIKKNAQNYKYAEQAKWYDPTKENRGFKKWPNSKYRLTDTNSNTFVRAMVNMLGMQFVEMSGLHIGAKTPEDVDPDQYTFGGKLEYPFRKPAKKP